MPQQIETRSYTTSPRPLSAESMRGAVRVLLSALLTLALAVSACCAPASATVQGDDYVGATTVTDRSLNITEVPDIEATYGILCDSDGNVLWSRGANEHAAMASITKIMTAIVALDNGALDDVCTVSANAASVGESSAGLSAGDELTLEQLLNGLLVHSGNDAAVAIAETIGGDVDTFVEMMNDKAADLHLADTHFANPTGLDADGHYSSASDICVMARYAMANSTFREIVGQETVTLDYGGSEETLKSSNALMCSWDACTGVKTGFTDDAGYCLASSAEQDGVELYAVVLGCADEVQRFIDSYMLLDWGFAHYRNYTLALADDVLVDVPMSGYLDRTVQAGVAEDVVANVLDYNGDISVDVKLVDISDGIVAGEEVGTVTWRQGETIVATAPLVARESVRAPMPWTSVFTAIVRLIGVATGDEGIASATMYAETVSVEMSDDETAGQIMDAATEKTIRAYVSSY